MSKFLLRVAPLLLPLAIAACHHASVMSPRYEGHWVVDPNPGFKLSKAASDMLAAHGQFDIKAAGICEGPDAMVVSSCRYLIVGKGDAGLMPLSAQPDGSGGLKVADPMSSDRSKGLATMHFDKRTGDLVFGDGGSQVVFYKRG